MNLKVVLAVLASFLLCACADSPPPKKQTPAKSEKKEKFKTAGGYHGAVFRARERATEKLDVVQETRSEQVREEKEFDQPSRKAD